MLSPAVQMLARNQTAPCLFQEIIRFDLSQALQGPRGSSTACNHVYLANPNRSRVPDLQQLPVESTVWSVSATCQKCIRHFDVVITFPEKTSPCPTQDNPIHLFRHVAFASDQEMNLSGFYQFECVSDTCKAQLTIHFRSSELNAEDVDSLTDPVVLEARLRSAQTDLPDARAKPALDVLRIFRSAIVDALEKDEKRDIPVDNKIFRICFGDGVDSLFERLGFQKIITSSNRAYWKLPNPAKHPLNPSYDEQRARLENVRDELSMLMVQRPDSEKRIINWTPPSLKLIHTDLERILSIHSDDSKTFRLGNIDIREQDTPYRALGTVCTFPDNLIIWSLRQQSAADPAKRPFYIECFKEIAGMRQSESLQTEAAIAESLQSESAKKDMDQQGSLSTYSEALTFIGAQDSTTDEFIWTLMTAKAAEESANESKARQAVDIIAQHRNSEVLRNQLAGSSTSKIQMTLQKAYKTLGVSEDLENSHLIAQYEMNSKENPAREADFKEALQLIATSRDSYDLRVFLGSPITTESSSANVTTQGEPRAIKNIGNTCYLNSLLQYLFTVRPLRELVAHIDEMGESVEQSRLASKLVGNSKVSRNEVRRALEFARELDKLFVSLKTARLPVVTPSTDLARLTLVNVVDRDVQRRASTITAPSSIFTEELGHLSETSEVALNGEDADTNMADRTESPIDLTDSVSTLGPDTTFDNTRPNGVSHDQSVEDLDIKGDQDYVNDSDIVYTHHDAERMNIDSTTHAQINGEFEKAAQAPLLPSRGGDASTQATQQSAKVTQEVENWAKQQDVREVMQNVLSQLRWAVRPQGQEKNGEQIDFVSRLFYGKEKYTVVTDKGEQPSVEPFLEIVIYLTGSCDIYSAFDDVFDQSEVEGSRTLQYRTITEMPPILQISVSRVGYNKVTRTPFKVNDPLQLYEHIYMDRYTESEEMLAKRRQAWACKTQLKLLKARRAKLDMPELDLDAAGVLRSTRDYLKGLEKHKEKLKLNIDLIDDALLNGLDNLANVVADEIIQLDLKISALNKNLSALFEADRQLAYNLHAVFIHRGDSSAKGGHWFIYIFDSEKNHWRCYNDETVTLVSETRPIFSPAKEWMEGTSSFIVYVREDMLGKIVQTVCREAESDDS